MFRLLDRLAKYFYVNTNFNQLLGNDPHNNLLVYDRNEVLIPSEKINVRSIIDFSHKVLPSLLDDWEISNDFTTLSRVEECKLYYIPTDLTDPKFYRTDGNFYIGTAKTKRKNRVYLGFDQGTATKFQIALLRLFLKAITTNDYDIINISLAEIRAKIRPQLAKVIEQLKNYSNENLKLILLTKIEGDVFAGFNALHLVCLLADDELLKTFCGYFERAVLIEAFNQKAEFEKVNPFILAIFSEGIETKTLVGLIKDFPEENKQALLTSFLAPYYSIDTTDATREIIRYLASPDLKDLFPSVKEYRKYVLDMFYRVNSALLISMFNKHYSKFQSIFSDDELRSLIRSMFVSMCIQKFSGETGLTNDRVKIIGNLTWNHARGERFSEMEDLLATYQACQEELAKNKAKEVKADGETEMRQQLSDLCEAEEERLLQSIKEKFSNDCVEIESNKLPAMMQERPNDSRDEIRQELYNQAQTQYNAEVKKAKQAAKDIEETKKTELQQQLQTRYVVDSNKKVLADEAEQIRAELEAMGHRLKLAQLMEQQVVLPFGALTTFAFLIISPNISDDQIQSLCDIAGRSEDDVVSLLASPCSRSMEVEDFFAPCSHLYLMLVLRPKLYFDILAKKVSEKLFSKLFDESVFRKNGDHVLMQPRSSLGALLLNSKIATENINQFIEAVPYDVLAKELEEDKQLLFRLFSPDYQETTFRLENDEHILFSLTDENLIKILFCLKQLDYSLHVYHLDDLSQNLYRFFSMPRLWSKNFAEHTWKVLKKMPEYFIYNFFTNYFAQNHPKEIDFEQHLEDKSAFRKFLLQVIFTPFYNKEPMKTYHCFFSLCKIAYNAERNSLLNESWVLSDRSIYGDVNMAGIEAMLVLLTESKFIQNAGFVDQILAIIKSDKFLETMQQHPELSEKLFAEDNQYQTLLKLSNENLLKLLKAIPFAALQAQGKISDSMLAFLSNSRLWESYIFIYDLKVIIMEASSSKENLTEGLAKDLMAYLVAQQLYPAQTAVGKAFIRDSLFTQQADFTPEQIPYLEKLYRVELDNALKNYNDPNERNERTAAFLISGLNGPEKIDWKQVIFPKTAAGCLGKYADKMSFTAIKTWITDFSRDLDHALSKPNANRTARTTAIYTKIQSLFQFYVPTLTIGVRAGASSAQVSQQGMFSRRVAEDCQTDCGKSMKQH